VDRYPMPEHLRDPKHKMPWNGACVLLEKNSSSYCTTSRNGEKALTLPLASLLSQRIVKTAQENARMRGANRCL